MLLFLLIISRIGLFSQVQSPDQFLGYKIGTRFTPHWKLVSYFNYIALQLPSMVKIEQYGVTNEGRPLMMCYVGSAENSSNLEGIRKNNIRLANLALDRMAATENTPAIVWLSYNVHGNEASSSEASMLTLFSLVDPSNARSREWLKNTIVIIDPCMNPDGRDRYVNWFNTVVGAQFNPDPQAREHREPWPGGRSNHYNFDLNRDWAWQTQVESQQRLQKYNEWLPQVHVDFHEMSYNAPYYFAPAQQPYHEVITTWQRDFQVLIGKNNAKYFDENGWLYFTKGGGYDLFYPGYGDTYPIYHGAIGMTFEQGGGGSSGLGITNSDGDTLTLVDRVNHHYTTGLSTIEISSQNAARLVKEFHKFYNAAVTTGSGEYKTYVIKRRSTNADLEAVLKRYLTNNGISYGVATTAGNYKGFNYNNGKEEAVAVVKDDILITAYQPNAVMLKVLFEPRSKQAEVTSRPYDITAWALPYALGLEAYAFRDRIELAGTMIQPVQDSAVLKPELKNAYAYVIPWKTLSSAKVLARLLQAGVRVRYQDQPFTVGGKNYDAGTLVVAKTSNAKFGEQLYDLIYKAAYENKDFRLGIDAVSTGFVDKGGDLGSNQVHLIEQPQIAMLTGEGIDQNAAGSLWFFFEKELGYPITLINAADMIGADLRKYNTLIMPDASNYRFLDDKVTNEQLKSWVRQGGKLIALQGALESLSKAEWGLKIKTDTSKKKELQEDSTFYDHIKKYSNRTKEDLLSVNSGTIYKVQLDNTHPLAFGYPDYYFTLKQDNLVYEFIKERGWNVGIFKKHNYVSGFLGTKAQEKLQDGLVFGVQEMGKGGVVYLADDVIFRNFWETGKLLLCNAVFMVGR